MRAPIAFPAPRPTSPAEGALRLSEIISALTFALDLTENALPGHSLRCCLLGMRIGVAAGLSSLELASLYYALQLKDAGCSANAARMSAMVGGGDDRVLKHAAKLVDWTRGARPDRHYLYALWKQCRPGDLWYRRLQHLFTLANSPENTTKDLFTLRCERGAGIMHHLQLGSDVAEAVHGLDEHWDGSGYPEGRRGEDIPLFSRICLVAQHLDVHAIASDPHRAVLALRGSRKSWYDPELVRTVFDLHQAGRLWAHCLPNDNVEATRNAVLQLDPGLVTHLTESRVNSICEAFAGIVDAKSPFTYRHSLGVMQVATAVAVELGLPPATVDTIRRGALLHDLGKLAVSNAILDKRGGLTDWEWATVRIHPEISGHILRRVPSFTHVALLAEQHHERLDGTGYPYGLREGDLCLESRIIAVADCYSAMAENRPYRKGLPKEQVLGVLLRDAPAKLDAECVAALDETARRWEDAFPDDPPEKANVPPSLEDALGWRWPVMNEANLHSL